MLWITTMKNNTNLFLVIYCLIVMIMYIKIVYTLMTNVHTDHTTYDTSYTNIEYVTTFLHKTKNVY